MLDAVEQVSGILDHGEIHLHLDLDRPPVDIVRISAPIGRTLREFALFALAFVLVDEVLEAFSLLDELLLEPLER